MQGDWTQMPGHRRQPAYTDEALRDIEEILFFTRERWGAAQRASYRRFIRQSIRDLAANPLVGRTCDELSLGLRRYPVGSHTAYYWVNDGVLVVARLLHQRRDAERVSWRKPGESETDTKA